MIILCSNIDIHIRMSILQYLYAFRCCDQAHERDVLCSLFLYKIYCSYSTAAGCQHRIYYEYLPAIQIFRHLAVIVMRFMSYRIAIQTYMTDFRIRDQAHQPVDQSKTCTQDRHDRAEKQRKKHALDREAEIVAYRTKSTDALKDLRSRHNAARLLLVNVPEIKNAMTDEESLPAAAERYLADYRSETDSLYRGRRIVCALAIAGGAAGVLGVPAAYELVRKRFWLITPVLVCILCSAAAATLNVRLGQGRMYIALATAILAFIQLLIVLPKRKKAKHEI